MLPTPTRNALRISVLIVCALALLLPSEAVSASRKKRPPFKNLRGNYKGVVTLVIQKNKKRTISGPVRIKVRLSRNRRVVQISIKGHVSSNNKNGRLLSSYRMSLAGNGRMRLNETVTPGIFKGNGTANIRKNGGRFTFRSVGYGARGLSAGNIKLRGGRTLQISQNFNDGTTAVNIKYIAPRTGRR